MVKAYNYKEVVQYYSHIDTRYKFIYHEFANLIEIHVWTKLPWYRRIYLGYTHDWKRIYLSFAGPLKKAIELFDENQKERNV